jgi:hypothetical protein
MGSGLHGRVPPASPCPRVDHPVSGRFDATGRPFGLAFAPAPAVPALASPRRTTRRLILQKARRHSVKPSSDRLEAHGFRLCFTPLDGVLFTVPSRYWFPIGRLRYLALGGGPPRFPPDVTCPAVLTRARHRGPHAVAYGALTRSGRPFQRRSADVVARGEGSVAPSARAVLPPGRQRRLARTPPRFGLLPVRSPLLGESFLFLRVLRCFSSPRAPRVTAVPGYRPGRVAPFGDLGIAGCQRLPRAFRRVAASFLGRRRQGIHRAPIFADCPSVIAPRSRRRPVREPGPTRSRGLDPSCVAQARGSRCGPCAAAGQGPRRARRLSRCSARPAGGAAGTRTPDLRRAKAALSQLSYGPKKPLAASS